MAQRADGVEGLDRVDQGRELAFLASAVDMLDLDREAGNALQGMQHGEAGAVGQESAIRDGTRRKSQLPIGRAVDLGLVAERTLGVGAACLIGYGKIIAPLADLQIADLGREGAPVLVAHQEGDGAQDFDIVDPDVAQGAVAEFDGERPGPQDASLGRGRLGPQLPDGPAWLLICHSILPSREAWLADSRVRSPGRFPGRSGSPGSYRYRVRPSHPAGARRGRPIPP